MSRNLKGGPELIAFLDKLPLNLRRNVVRGGARAGARVIQKEARARLSSKKTGLTRKSIKVSVDSDRAGIRVVAKVLTRGPHAYIAPWLERGVRPHVISVTDQDRGTTMTRHGPRLNSVRSVNNKIHSGSLVIGKSFVGPVVQHPGIGARPFMGPALEARATDAIKAMGVYISNRLQMGRISAPLLDMGDDE